MTEIKLDARVRKGVAQALESWATHMFDDQTGEWTAVITLGHRSRTESVETDDDMDYVARGVKLSLLDAEIVTGDHKAAAERARDAARRERLTAGTLLDDAFRTDRD